MRFFGAKSACSQPFTSPLACYGAAGNPLPLAQGGEAEWIAAILALGGIPGLIVLSIVKAFGIEE